MGRKRIRRRVAQVLNALEEFPKKTADLKRAERAEARVRRKKASTEFHAICQAENKAESARITEKEQVRAERRNTAPALEQQVQQPATVLPQPVPATHSAGYLTSVRYDDQGRSHVEYVRDRNGNPIPARHGPTQAAKPEPAKALEPKEQPDPNSAPAATAGLTPPDGAWFSGCGRPRSLLERWNLGRASGQGQTESAGRRAGHNGEFGFADPGGTVSRNINMTRVRGWTTFGDWEP